LGIRNKEGYTGRYQAGAAWLADAGLIRGGSAAVKAAMSRDGFKSEWKWAQSGGMSKFLQDDSNWIEGMGLQKYMASAEIQDRAFKANSDKSYRSLLNKGVITPGMGQDKIAGILKARHIGGEGGAALAARGIAGKADANNTTPLKYLNDLAAGNAYTKAFVTTNPIGVPSTPAITPPPAIAESEPVMNPLTSGNRQQQSLTLKTDSMVGQDVSDRQIAHLVTGGYARV
jgi:hypothetical protein